MALTKGENSYVSVSEADSYFQNRLNSSGWETAEPKDKSKALVTATAILNDLEWPGTSISETQQLAFPRSGTYFEPRLGREVSFDPIPDRVIRAVYELANHLLNNEDLLDETGSLKELGVGEISLKFNVNSSSVSLLPSSVMRIIQPLKSNKGPSNMWWRAN